MRISSILFVVLIFSIQSFPQKLDNFFSVKWGYSTEIIKEILSNPKDIKLIEDKGDTLTFAGGNLSKIPVNTWSFYFVSDKLFEIRLNLKWGDECYGKILRYLMTNLGEYSHLHLGENEGLDLFWYIEEDINEIDEFIILSFVPIYNQVRLIYTDKILSEEYMDVIFR